MKVRRNLSLGTYYRRPQLKKQEWVFAKTTEKEVFVHTSTEGFLVQNKSKKQRQEGNHRE